MNRKLLFVVFLVTSNLLFVASAKADLIAAWDVDGVNLSSGFSAPYLLGSSSSHANVNGGLTLGAGVNSSTANDSYGFKISVGDTQNSLAGAIANDHFIQFEVTIDSGFSLNLESLEFYGGSSGNGADDVVLMSSVDGYSSGSEIASVTGIQGITGGFDTDDSGFGGPIDLSDSRYQGLSGTVSFRLYGYNTVDGGGSTSIRSLAGNDLVINGSISAVPEPATVGILCALGGGFLIRRRYLLKKKSAEKPLLDV